MIVRARNGCYEGLESYAEITFPRFSMANKRSAADLLSDTIGAIQSHRKATNELQQARLEDVEVAWEAVLKASRELREQISSNARVRYFTIARDNNSISVSFRSTNATARGELLEMHRHHPEGRYPDTHAIWVRESERDERRLTNGEEAVTLLVRFCARNLAD